jgi:hypothetical protein
LTLLMMAALPAAAAAQSVEGAFERTLTVSGPVDLDVVSGSGSIEIRPGAAGRLEVRARVRAGRDWGFGRSRLSAEERVRRIEASPPIEQTGDRVRIGRIVDDDVRDGVSISFTLTVPPETSVVSSTGSGAHRIEGVRGAVEATSGSGSIRIQDVGRDVRATTGSGSIAALMVGGSFEARSGSGAIEGSGVTGAIDVRTGSGRIDVSQTGGGDVHASSGSGSITLRGIRGGLRASTASGSLAVQGEQTADWRLSSASGSITIDLEGTPAFTLDAHSNSGGIVTDFPVTVAGTIGRRDLRGSVNGGGALLHVRSTSGGIRIR